MKFKPQTKEELYRVIKEIVINQLSEKSYSYGLKDVDTSLIYDMDELFSCGHRNDKNFEINEKIDWEDPRNYIVNWNINSVIKMQYMFFNSNFNQDLSNWIFTLNRNCNLSDFNFQSEHINTFGIIYNYSDFIKVHVTKDFINNIFKNGNDIEKFKLLKIIKQYPDIVKNIDIGRKLL